MVLLTAMALKLNAISLLVVKSDEAYTYMSQSRNPRHSNIIQTTKCVVAFLENFQL